MTERTLLDEIIHFGVMAADMEALRSTPLSPVRNPDGSRQYETAAEHVRRIVNVAIRHLIDVGLLQVDPEAETRMDEGVALEYKP